MPDIALLQMFPETSPNDGLGIICVPGSVHTNRTKTTCDSALTDGGFAMPDHQPG